MGTDYETARIKAKAEAFDTIYNEMYDKQKESYKKMQAYMQNPTVRDYIEAKREWEKAAETLDRMYDVWESKYEDLKTYEEKQE